MKILVKFETNIHGTRAPEISYIKSDQGSRNFIYQIGPGVVSGLPGTDVRHGTKHKSDPSQMQLFLTNNCYRITNQNTCSSK